MKKKSIFINMHYLELGGAEMALIGLLNAFDYNKVEVDLFLNKHSGPYLKYIPKEVNLLPEIKQYANIETPISKLVRNIQFTSIIHKLKSRAKLKKYLSSHPGFDSVASHIYMDYYIKVLPPIKINKYYDLAINFLDPPHIVQDLINARTKIEWIHTDFSAIPYDTNLTFNRWEKNDYIISISDEITKTFINVFPSFHNKIIKIENIISPSFVRSRADEFIPSEYNQQENTLCSIGRLNAAAKNFKNIPHIAKIIKDSGIKFKWFIIGPGDNSEIEKQIMLTGTCDVVKIIGPRTNPYPYIKNCTIYIQPSLFEGKSICVRESQILCKPAIITNYPTSKSQIQHNIDGIICNMDNSDIADAIIELLGNNTKQQQIISHLKTHDYGFEDEVNKLYQLIQS